MVLLKASKSKNKKEQAEKGKSHKKGNIYIYLIPISNVICMARITNWNYLAGEFLRKKKVFSCVLFNVRCAICFSHFGG